MQAVNSYFTRVEQEARSSELRLDPVIGRTGIAGPPRIPGGIYERPGPILSRKVGVDQAAIKSLLQEAMRDGTKLDCWYTDAEGNETRRKITVSALENRGRPFLESYAIVWDLDKQEPRSFRVERIKRVEVIG